MKLPSLPKVGDFQLWKRRVITETAAASGRGDAGVAWISQVFDDGMDLASLKKSGSGFDSLDVKLLNAVHRITDNSPKGVMLETVIQREVSERRQINGRQALLVLLLFLTTPRGR